MLIERALVHLLGVFGISVSSPLSSGSGSGSTTTGTTATRAAAVTNPPEKRSSSNTTTDIRTSDGLRGPRNGNGKGLGKSRWGKKSGGGGASSHHRYHATVLEMLDSPSNPLHEVLGRGEVRTQLGRAKDLRNRWKTADYDDDDDEEEGGGGRRGPPGTRKKLPAPLESYDLANMLREISDGFGKGFEVAEGYVAGLMLLGGREEDTVMDWSEEVEREEQLGEEKSSVTIGGGGWQVGMDEGWEFMVDAMDWEAI